MECFTADFFWILQNCQNLSLGSRLTTYPSIPSISGISMKFRNFLRTKVVSLKCYLGQTEMVLWSFLDSFILSNLANFLPDIEKSVSVKLVEVWLCFTQYHSVLFSSLSIFEFVMACICITNIISVQVTKNTNFDKIFLICRLVWSILEIPLTIFEIAKSTSALWSLIHCVRTR